MKIAIIFLIIGLLIGISGVALSKNDMSEKVEVTCYDKYSSEIDGLTCYKQPIKTGYVIMILSGFAIMVSSILFTGR